MVLRIRFIGFVMPGYEDRQTRWRVASPECVEFPDGRSEMWPWILLRAHGVIANLPLC